MPASRRGQLRFVTVRLQSQAKTETKNSFSKFKVCAQVLRKNVAIRKLNDEEGGVYFIQSLHRFTTVDLFKNWNL